MTKFKNLDKLEIGKAILNKRKRLDMTRKELSDALDLSKEDEKNIAKWEDGK